MAIFSRRALLVGGSRPVHRSPVLRDATSSAARCQAEEPAAIRSRRSTRPRVRRQESFGRERRRHDPGPTLFAQPGQNLTITINNQLPVNPPAPIPNRHGVLTTIWSRCRASRPAVACSRPDRSDEQPTLVQYDEPARSRNPDGPEFVRLGPATGRDVRRRRSRRTYTYAFLVPPDQPSGLYWPSQPPRPTDVEVSGGWLA